MAAYRRVYDSRHLQADCQELTGISSGTLRSVIEYGYLYLIIVSYRIACSVPEMELGHIL